MADPRAFLSYDYDHNQIPKTMFAGQCHQESPTPFTVTDWSSKTSLPQATWEAEIKKKIGQTNMLIVLVGKTMSTATGVNKEIVMAAEKDVPVFGVYVDGATSASPLPVGLPRSAVIVWTWAGVATMVNKCMKLGKNR